MSRYQIIGKSLYVEQSGVAGVSCEFVAISEGKLSISEPRDNRECFPGMAWVRSGGICEFLLFFLGSVFGFIV